MGFLRGLGKTFGKATTFGLPGLFGMLGGRKGSMGNPADAGMGYLNQIPGATGEYYKPFIESGREAERMANPIYERMASTPGAFIEELMKGYTPSRGYQFKQGEMERAMRNTAAHGGFVGTPYNQQQQAELTQGLLSQDMQDFLNNLFAAQQTGLGGLEERIGRGFKAGTGYGDILGANLGTQGTYKYMGALDRMNMDQARRNARLGFFSNILGQGASLFGGGFR